MHTYIYPLFSLPLLFRLSPASGCRPLVLLSGVQHNHFFFVQPTVPCLVCRTHRVWISVSYCRVWPMLFRFIPSGYFCLQFCTRELEYLCCSLVHFLKRRVWQMHKCCAAYDSQMHVMWWHLTKISFRLQRCTKERLNEEWVTQTFSNQDVSKKSAQNFCQVSVYSLGRF